MVYPFHFFLILNICGLYCHWIGNDWKKNIFPSLFLSEILTNHAEDIEPWDFYDHSNIKNQNQNLRAQGFIDCFLFVWLRFIELFSEVKYFHFWLTDWTKWNVKRALVFRDLQKWLLHLKFEIWKNGVAMCHNGVISYQNYYKFLHKPRKHKYWLLSWHRHFS